MSLLGSNMAPGVRSELCRRAKIIPEGYGPWTHARIPWARFSPCVHTGNGEDSTRESRRKRHILFGGNLKTLDSSYRTNKTMRMGPYSDNYMDVRDGLSGGTRRNSPRPGIKSVKVEEKGTLGGIKKVTVEITIWDRATLDDMQYSLFALGKHALVEWGWNIDTTGDMVTTNLGKSQTAVSQTDSSLNCQIRTKQTYHNFCYDAIRGIISNFNWRVNENSGFDCTVTLTSKGTTFLATPTETATMHSGCNEDPDDTSSEIDKVHRPNLEQPLYFLRQSLRTTHSDKKAYKNPDGGSPIGMAALFDKELGAMDWIASFFGSEPTNAELDFFITWDYFEEYIVNRKLAPMYAAISNAAGNQNQETSTTNPGKDTCSGASTTNPQMFKRAYDEASGKMFEHPRSNSSVYSLDSRGTVLRNSPFLLSADPGKVMLPRQEHWVLHPTSISTVGSIGAFISGITAYVGEYVTSRVKSISWKNKTGNHSKAKKDAEKAQEKAKEEALDKAAQESNVDGSTSDTLEDFKAFDHKFSPSVGPGSSGEGLLSNILINVAFIEEVCNEAKSLDEFLDMILEGTQAACGDIWELVIVEDPDNPQVVRVIDRNMVRKSPEVKGFHFPGIGRKSIARTIDMETDIDSKMAAMMMYGSNKAETTGNGQPMGGASSNEYRLFNPKTQDLVMDGIVLPDSKAQTVGSDCCADTIATDANAMQDAWHGYYKSAEEIADEVNEDSVEGMVTAMRKLLNMADPNQGLPTTDAATVKAYTGGDEVITIPLKVSLTIDGISGLRWGNYIGFTGNTEIPKRYTSDKTHGGSSFQIVGIDHEITAGDWVTNIRTVMRPGACIGTGITNCGSNQGLLPSSIMPSTETLKFDLIPITPPTTKKQKQDEETEEDEFDLVKLEPIQPQLIPTETNMEIEKAKCPCEDGSNHEDCCNEPVTGEDTNPSILPNVNQDQETNTAKGCQCEDGSFLEECCEDEEEPSETDPAACDDPVPSPEPGIVEVIETKEGKEPDIIIEDTVEEEDCEGWEKRGSVIASGNMRYRSGPLFEDVWYYEFRSDPKNCYFINLYVWHGFDGSNDGITSKPIFSRMQPPSSNTRTNLFGLTNNFTAAILNNMADMDQAASAYSLASDGRRDLKESKKFLKKMKWAAYRRRYGTSNHFKKGEENVQVPGSRLSPGLWLSEQVKWFRDDQPFEVNKPKNEGDGGAAEYSKWADKKGRGIGASAKLSWVQMRKGDNEALGAFMKAQLQKIGYDNHSPIMRQVSRNFKTWSKSAQFGGVGRNNYGYRKDIFDSRSNRIQIDKDLLTGEGWAQRGFGWAQDVSQELFVGSLEKQEYDKATESYKFNSEAIQAQGADSPFKKYSGKAFYSDDMGNYRDILLFAFGG